MAAKNKRKDDPYIRKAGETYLEYQNRIVKMEQAERDKARPLVSAEAEQHGDYRWQTVHQFEGGGMSRAETKLNVKASPYAMWKAQRMFTETQDAAIKYCMRLWEFLPPLPRCTAAYGETIRGASTGCESEAAANAYLDAKEGLARIIGGVDRNGKEIRGYFSGPLKTYWDVFENCIRFDMPAGVAGSELGYGGRSGKGKAHLIVCFVADVIADKERFDR